MSKVLIISEDIVGRNMAGPAIRCYEFARALAGKHDVTLAVPKTADIGGDGFAVREYSGASIGKMAAEADVVVASGYLLRKHPALISADKPLVVDIYDPFILENLEIHRGKPMADRIHIHEGDLGVQLESLRAGDFFLCASERQRDFWLGMLAAMNRINPEAYDADRDARRLLDVVPFGIPDNPPQASKKVLKGVYPGINQDDKVILWGGGIWNWFDPLTLINAMDEITKTREDIKLFFMGVKHPNPDIPQMDMCRAAIALSDKLGLTGRTVFFNDWVSYEDRENYLIESDAAVSLHFDHLETKYSFRTRILDCIWASLPVITTGGDSLSELVESRRLGVTVPPEDVAATKAAILRLIDDAGFNAACRKNLKREAGAYKWSQVTKPLAAFCDAPYKTRGPQDPNGRPESFFGRAKRVSRSLGSRLLSRARGLDAAGQAIVAVLAMTFFLGSLFAAVTPLWQTPDEPTHTAFVENVAYLHRIPTLQDEITPAVYDSLNKSGYWPELVHSLRYPGGRKMPLSAAGHPPFYYIVVAPIFWAATPFGIGGQVYALRLFGVLMAMLTVWLAYLTAGVLFPKDRFIQVLTAVLIGLQPMFLFIMAGVNNDALINPLFAAGFYVLSLLIVKGFDRRRAVALGLLLGLGLATKPSFVIMIPAAFAALAVRAIMSRNVKEAARDAGLTALAGLFASSWFLLLNAKIYQTLLGNAAGGGGTPGWSKFMSSSALRDYFLRKIGPQFFGEFGWLAISMNPYVYEALYVFCLIAAFGFLVWLVRAARKREIKIPLTVSLIMMAGTTVGIIIAVMRFDILTGGGSQGRYLFTALVPISLFLAAGVRGLTPDGLRKFVLPAAGIGFLAFTLLALFGYIMPHFYLT